MNTETSRRDFLRQAAGVTVAAAAAAALSPSLAEAASSISSPTVRSSTSQAQIGTLSNPTLGSVKVFQPRIETRVHSNPYYNRLIKESSLSVRGAVAIQAADGSVPLPGALGVSVISGHRTSGARPFKNLHKLKVGDRLTYTSTGGVATTFEVKEIAVVKHTSKDYAAAFQEVMFNEVKYGSDTRLNLYACTRAPGRGLPTRTTTPGASLDARPTSTSYRLVVFCAKV